MASVGTRKEKECRMKETACQRELALMLDKKKLAWSLMDMCYSCHSPVADRTSFCGKAQCHVGVALITTGYTIPLRSEWE